MADRETVNNRIPETVKQLLARNYAPLEAAEVREIEGDASTRRYFRYAPAGVVVALYEQPFQTRDFPFARAAELLTSIDIPVPEILAVDGRAGLVLQEDVGRTSLHRLHEERPAEADRWLEEAVDYAARIQVEGSRLIGSEIEAANNRLDGDRFEWELSFFRRHFLQGLCELPVPELVTEQCCRLAAEAARDGKWLCHRDFQVRNLFLHGDRLVVIDFQDAQPGPLHYDIASLLLDSIDLPEERVDTLLERYRGRLRQAGAPEAAAAASVPNAGWRRSFDAVAAQRLVKALGTYGFQISDRSQDRYRQLVGPTLGRACRLLAKLKDYPALREILEEAAGDAATGCRPAVRL